VSIPYSIVVEIDPWIADPEVKTKRKESKSKKWPAWEDDFSDVAGRAI